MTRLLKKESNQLPSVFLGAVRKALKDIRWEVTHTEYKGNVVEAKFALDTDSDFTISGLLCSYTEGDVTITLGKGNVIKYSFLCPPTSYPKEDVYDYAKHSEGNEDEALYDLADWIHGKMHIEHESLDLSHFDSEDDSLIDGISKSIQHDLEKYLSDLEYDLTRMEKDFVRDYKHALDEINEESVNESADRDSDGVIVKVGNKWRIKGKKVKYWDAHYDTKKDAEAALRAYWANKKQESYEDKRITDIFDIAEFLNQTDRLGKWEPIFGQNKTLIWHSNDGVIDVMIRRPWYDTNTWFVEVFKNNKRIKETKLTVSGSSLIEQVSIISNKIRDMFLD